jgi:di-N-acetylchitobiase
MWYDDPQSLKKKYDLAARYSLRGVGMWAAEHVDYSNTAVGLKQRAEMWGVLPTPVKLHYEVLHV